MQETDEEFAERQQMIGRTARGDAAFKVAEKAIEGAGMLWGLLIAALFVAMVVAFVIALVSGPPV